MKLLVVFMSVVSALRFDMSKDGTDRPVASCEVRVTQFEKEDWPSGPFGLQVDIINSAQQLVILSISFLNIEVIQETDFSIYSSSIQAVSTLPSFSRSSLRLR